jgi:LPS O-antigen subunit length determinant protein (WzzB/FepE family)
LQRSLSNIYQNSFQINSSRTELSNRDKTFSSTLYAEVVKNLETLKLSLINQTPVIQILDTPKYPLFNQRIPVRYSLIIGFAVGFVFSFFFALYKYTSN